MPCTYTGPSRFTKSAIVKKKKEIAKKSVPVCCRRMKLKMEEEEGVKMMMPSVPFSGRPGEDDAQDAASKIYFSFSIFTDLFFLPKYHESILILSIF